MSVKSKINYKKCLFNRNIKIQDDYVEMYKMFKIKFLKLTEVF